MNALAEIAYRAAIQASRRKFEAPALLNNYLGRPFPSGTRHRVLLVYYADELAEPQFLPFFRYAKRFADEGIAFRACPIASAEALYYARDATAIFVQGPYDHTDTMVRSFLAAARAAVPSLAITFFDWSAPADLRFAIETVPFIDHYVKKSLLKDRAQYLSAVGGHTNLTDHYSARFNLTNTPREWSVPTTVLPRRWVVERTLAWLNRCRRLAKDWEASIASSEAWMVVSSIRRMTRRIAKLEL